MTELEQAQEVLRRWREAAGKNYNRAILEWDPVDERWQCELRWYGEVDMLKSANMESPLEASIECTKATPWPQSAPEPDEDSDHEKRVAELEAESQRKLDLQWEAVKATDRECAELSVKNQELRARVGELEAELAASIEENKRPFLSAYYPWDCPSCGRRRVEGGRVPICEKCDWRPNCDPEDLAMEIPEDNDVFAHRSGALGEDC